MDALIIMIDGVQMPGDAKLFVIIEADSHLRLGFGACQGGKEEAGKDGDDRNNDQ